MQRYAFMSKFVGISKFEIDALVVSFLSLHLPCKFLILFDLVSTLVLDLRLCVQALSQASSFFDHL